jgi:hypothetical protein
MSLNDESAQSPTGNTGSKTGRARRSIGIVGWSLAIFFVGLGLYLLSLGVREFYGYQVGTPTTATGIECVGGLPDSGSDTSASYGDFLRAFTLSRACHGAWRIDGQSQTGPIVGVQHLGSADVHVKGGIAFAAPLTSGWFYGHFLGGLFVIVVLGLGQLWDVGRLWRWMKPGRG